MEKGIRNDDNTLQIAFFGGSTGYNGEPPIIDLIEKNLNSNSDRKNALLYDSSSIYPDENLNEYQESKHID